ncbi:thioredoxin family protein [Candidatus Uabimicrobium sp. HlEnr_7]|uniref:thioredoxin family protein n=1 Tax=Candidatus Uabimicrobium helgolandensis TaxID=3095367 RepID=UPI003559350B
MKNICYLLILISFCLPCFADKAEDSKKSHSLWLTDLDKGKEQAKKQNKLILVDFTGSDWCHWCVRLDKEVFEHKEFKEYAKNNLVLVMLDFPAKKKLPAAVKEKNNKAKKKYAIRGYPTILLLDHTGKEVARTGYKKGGPKNYVKHLTSILEEYKKSAKK